jgi:hypothetical protein
MNDIVSDANRRRLGLLFDAKKKVENLLILKDAVYNALRIALIKYVVEIFSVQLFWYWRESTFILNYHKSL